MAPLPERVLIVIVVEVAEVLVVLVELVTVNVVVVGLVVVRLARFVGVELVVVVPAVAIRMKLAPVVVLGAQAAQLQCHNWR